MSESHLGSDVHHNHAYRVSAPPPRDERAHLMQLEDALPDGVEFREVPRRPQSASTKLLCAGFSLGSRGVEAKLLSHVVQGFRGVKPLRVNGLELHIVEHGKEALEELLQGV